MATETKQRAVIGIDFGSADSYVGFISKGTVEITQNEVSQRKTPTLVGFTDKERLLGDQALSLIKSNTKNTCRNFKHLLGERWNSPVVEVEHFWSTAPIVEDEGAGGVGFGVSFKGEPREFSTTAVTAMFLTKLKDITEAWTSMVVEEAVIGVPSHFSHFQRVALLDAAKIAGLKVLRLMNEHSAIALEYGYWRSNSFDVEKPHTVAFCMMGHTIFSVAICRFVKGKMTVLCEKSAKVGGRDMDECLIRVFAEQFKKKTGCDVLSNKKALFKLEDAVTKTKKILSANSESSITCECLMEDEDFSSKIDRLDFLEMCQPMMDKVAAVLAGAINNCGVAVSGIDVVEVCGGSSRVPWVKEMCSKAFGGKELSTTMNADECVARGCTIMAAVLSSSYKARPFKVEDTVPFPVSLAWMSAPEAAASQNGEGQPEQTQGPSERSAVVFPPHSLMNLSKVMTFFRKGTFELTATYAGGGEEDLPASLPRQLGSYKVELPAQPEKKKVKVRASLTVHGTFEIASAQLVEEDGKQDEIGEATGQPPAVDQEEAAPNGGTAGGDGDGEGTGALKRRNSAGGEGGRRIVRRTDLVVTPAGCPGLPEVELAKRKADEDRMIADMHEIEDTNARRNDLESYILTMRSSIDSGGKYGPFVKDIDRTALTELLTKIEDWLYDHHDDGKQVFIEKLAEVKVLGGPIERRFREEEKRPEVVAAFERKAKAVKEAVAQAKPKNGDVSQVRSLEMACDAALQWIAEMSDKQKAKPRHEDPAFGAADVKARLEDLTKVALAILPGALGLSEASIDADSVCASPVAEPGPL
mmetsp:Transcript_16571/g.43554  ORF Transcript_16571/g.43554 Transcript_16571/m.43554 type:complete len:811 (+) Transcript_16571:1-2433(+)